MKTIIATLRLGFLIFIVLVFNACRKKESADSENFATAPPENLTEEEQQTYHTDTAYKYEYRTGTSGDYQYDYDVSGTDDNGDEVTGNVTMHGKYGSGTITTANGDDVDVETEWVDYGKLKATDSDGNEYELEAD